MATLLLRLVLYACLVPLITSELVIDVEPNVIYEEITPKLVINCSITNNEVTNIKVIKSLSILTYNTIMKKFNVLSAMDATTFSLQQLAEVKDAQIKTGNLFLALVINNPTRSDALVYKCEAFGDNSLVKNITIASKREVSDATNITGYIDEIKRLKKIETKLTNIETTQDCSLRSNEEDALDNNRIQLTFRASSEVIKELIQPLSLKCSIQSPKELMMIANLCAISF
uniref:Uncharacterized protein n=1 Tax=Biomphalaria glabrata TaxID=6526 RepID=A0A2C9K866_BIOGL